MTRPTNTPAADDERRPQLRVVPTSAVTDSEAPIGTSDRNTTSSSAPTRGASVHARARLEDQTAVTQRGGRVVEIMHRSAAYLNPPDVWADDRPSLRKQWNYARWGQQHPPDGLLRGLSIALYCVGLLPQAIAYYVAWIAERPARLITAYVLLALVLQIPVVRAVLTTLAALIAVPLTWLI
jgi:hypothetical protein